MLTIKRQRLKHGGLKTTIEASKLTERFCKAIDNKGLIKPKESKAKKVRALVALEAENNKVIGLIERKEAHKKKAEKNAFFKNKRLQEVRIKDRKVFY